MKRLSLLLLFVSGIAFGQYSNRQDQALPFLEEFNQEAQARGMKVEKIADSILILDQPLYYGEEADGITWGRGKNISIELKASVLQDEEKGFGLFFHEAGHAFGLEDCKKCRYNLMKHQANQRSDFLYKDERLRRLFLDIFFAAIRDPEAYNSKHLHY